MVSGDFSAANWRHNIRADTCVSAIWRGKPEEWANKSPPGLKRLVEEENQGGGYCYARYRTQLYQDRAQSPSKPMECFEWTEVIAWHWRIPSTSSWVGVSIKLCGALHETKFSGSPVHIDATHKPRLTVIYIDFERDH
ncbi:hypothetical protein SCLCIDRAFT_963150 [Scleroderma citrinum Foug A]|uniref:Uncharacterized protein n=1 Tax=Scleroderma citrinum Foug A TaxID=1036808 RepID=A0A0C3DVK7_9AGAM|nr:hypothetical protein SCLCIDRAFT_963150 [Scleroderma citrinum Foug A]